MRYFLLTLTVLLGLVGCGYRFGDIKPLPMADVQTLGIPTFINKTFENRIEVLAADTLIKQFQQDGTYAIVSDKTADAVLYGEITDIERFQARPVLRNVLATAEFELRVRVSYEVVERTTGRLLMTGVVIGETTFFSSPDLQIEETQAIPVALQRASVDIVSRVTEGF